MFPSRPQTAGCRTGAGTGHGMPPTQNPSGALSPCLRQVCGRGGANAGQTHLGRILNCLEVPNRCRLINMAKGLPRHVLPLTAIARRVEHIW